MAQQNKVLPLLPLRGVIVFPHSITNLDIGRAKSIVALESAMLNKQQIFLAAQKDVKEDNPRAEDIFLYGTLAEIKWKYSYRNRRNKPRKNIDFPQHYAIFYG